MKCHRCSQHVDELWATVEMFSRLGQVTAYDLCKPCTGVAYAFVLNRPLNLEDPMNTIWPAIHDPDDIDDAEHPMSCICEECDPDFAMERRRDERADRAS